MKAMSCALLYWPYGYNSDERKSCVRRGVVPTYEKLKLGNSKIEQSLIT